MDVNNSIKYQKYKQKYITLKNQLAGLDFFKKKIPTPTSPITPPAPTGPMLDIYKYTAHRADGTGYERYFIRAKNEDTLGDINLWTKGFIEGKIQYLVINPTDSSLRNFTYKKNREWEEEDEDWKDLTKIDSVPYKNIKKI